MKTILICSLLLALALSTVVPRVTPIKTHAPITYKVNLEDSPLKRWDQIIKDFKVPLDKFINYFDMLPIPPAFFEGVDWYAKNVYEHQDFVKEVEAIAQISGHPFDKLFFMNFFYEFSTFKACTGIVLRNSEGKIMHGRNLDFEMWNLISNLVANVEYYKGGQLVFSVDTVIGSVFALTGIRHGAFAINVDTRKEDHIYDDFISILVDNAIPTVWLLRKTLEQQTTYADAIKRLKAEKIGGPVYYVVSGASGNEGGVIERDTEAVHAFYELTDDTWFIVQTNYDRDQPEPLHDPRRIPVEQRIKARGNVGFTEKELLTNYMAEWPTFNIATIMTAIMVPGNGYHNTTIWYGNNPSIPEPTSLRVEE